MDLYKLSNDVLGAVDHEAFALEKDIQVLVEKNLARIIHPEQADVA